MSQATPRTRHMLRNARAALVDALASGTVAAALSTAVIAIASRVQTGHAARGTNDTSHWLWGARAFRVRRADAAHTLAGYAIHHACSVFWAVGYEVWQRRRPAGGTASAMRAGGIAALAAAVDYTIVPQRLTPGFERHLSRPAMTAVYVAFGAGLALAALLRRRA